MAPRSAFCPAQLLCRDLPVSLPTATGGSDALIPAPCQHPRDCLPLGKRTSQPSLRAVTCAGPSQGPRKEEGC